MYLALSEGKKKQEPGQTPHQLINYILTIFYLEEPSTLSATLFFFSLFMLTSYSYLSGNVSHDDHKLYFSDWEKFFSEGSACQSQNCSINVKYSLELGPLTPGLPFWIGVTAIVLKRTSFKEILLLEWQDLFDLGHFLIYITNPVIILCLSQ